jgi:hypothetical protein
LILVFTSFSAELPLGMQRWKASAFMGQISAKWNSMSKEEQEAATLDGYEDLKGHCENEGPRHSYCPHTCLP